MSRHTILCINDDKNALSAFERVFLDEDNLEIIAASSGEQGLEILKGKSVDLIITDLYMPGIDGWKLCRLLRSSEFPDCNNIPILVVSATYSGAEVEEITKELGADGFISIPYNQDDFLSTVKDLLSGKTKQKKLKILVVEDHESLRKIVCEWFKEHGYLIFEASNANQARNIFEDMHPEIVILDYHLPDHKGDELLKTFKSTENQAAVLVITGDTTPELAVKVTKMGADAYVRKPFKPQYLIELCEKIRREWSLLRVETLLENRTLDFQRVLETTADGIMVTDPKGCITMVNKSIERMLGYLRSELIGKNVAELKPEREEHKEQARNFYATLVEKGSVSRRERTWLKKDGSPIYIEMSAAFLKDNNHNVTGGVVTVRDNTERKQSQEVLQKTNDHLDNIIESSLDSIVITDNKGYVTRTNKSFIELLGYIEEKQVIGKHMAEFSPTEAGTYESVTGASVHIDKEFLDSIIAAMSKLTKEGKISNLEFYLIRTDKKVISVEENIVNLYNKEGERTGTVGVIRDITERKKFEEAIRISEEKYQNLIENANDAVISINKDGIIVTLNKKVEEMYGYTRDELLGKSVILLVPPQRREEQKKALEKLRTIFKVERFRRTLETRAFGKDGKEFPVETSMFSSEIQGESILTSFVRDITERKKMEQKLIQSEKLKSLGELAGGVAHDFNNILAAILGRVQLLRMQIKPPSGKREKRKSMLDLKAGLEVIERASLDGAETVRRIQEFSKRRVEDKNFDRIDINELINNALEFTRVRWKNEAESKGIKIKIQKELSPLVPLQGSSSELREVFTNLINNAVDTMPQGGKIKIKTSTDNNHVVIKIGDEGSGIPKSIRDRIFDPFFTTKGVQSTGLGLSVSYGIINRHRGMITVDSIESKGATFTIRLPLSDKTDTKERKEQKVVLEAKKQEKATILVIEDEEDVRKLLRDILTDVGHDVETAVNGSQGLKLFKEKEFDLVFTDLGMPGISGWHVAEEVKEIDSKTPVALITGWGVELEDYELRKSGVDFIVNKPFRVDQVIELVQKGIKLRKKVVRMTQSTKKKKTINKKNA